MKPNSHQRLDDLVAFILAAANRDGDWTRRCLGLIHIIKYAYLADLHESEAGRTLMTGAHWTFFHFGPWDGALCERIEKSVARLGATQFEVPSRVGDDRRCWLWNKDIDTYDDVRVRIPLDTRLRLAREIHDYGNDTASLLDYVYKTKPMLDAAPRDRLMFVAERATEYAVGEAGAALVVADVVGEAGRPLLVADAPQQSARKRQKQLERVKEQLRTRLTEWRSERAAEVAAATVDPPPRYDRIFSDGIAWLDSLDGDPVTPSEGVLAVDDSVWHSPARSGGNRG